MAVLSGDKTYVTVEKGDTLWDIAQGFLGSGSKYKTLASINNIPNPDLVYPGEIIYLYKSSSKSTKAYSNKKATIQQFGILSTSEQENELFATWNWSKESETESYKVEWVYDTGDGVWLNGNTSNNTVDSDNRALSRQSLYTIPSGARRVRFRVKPISKKKKNSESTYWTASWSDTKIHTDSTPLTTPSAPTDIEIDDLTLTVTMDGLNNTITQVEFQIFRDNVSAAYKSSGKVKVQTGHVSYSCAVVAGSEYKVRCRMWDDDNQKSDWSPYSGNVSSKPNAPAGFTSCRAISETSVYLRWDAVPTAESYEIEHTTDKKNFDLATREENPTLVSGVTLTEHTIVGLESGNEHFFRIRAVKTDDAKSDWSSVSSVVIGDKPEPPTTWSSTTTAVIGEDLIFYWLHNSADGSYQTAAEVEIIANNVAELVEIDTFTEDDADSVSSKVIDTTKYSNDTEIKWRVRTWGALAESSDWSIQRQVTVYTKPEVQLSLLDSSNQNIDILTSFPLNIKASATPVTQTPLGFYITITSNDSYDTTDAIGNTKTISEGDTVYSKHFDTTALNVSIAAGDIDLENGVEYTVTCVVSLDSGLTATHSLPFTVSWEDAWYEPNAEIAIDRDTLTAQIRPYCEERYIVNYRARYVSAMRRYIKTDEVLQFAWGEPVAGATTTTGETVYIGSDGDTDDIYFCEVEEATPIENVYLAVYRREFDGSFTTIADGLDGANRTTVTDPHPALDMARYRIVATDKTTGAVSYNDLPGHLVDCHSIVIQWDEKWSDFDVEEDAEPVEPSWSGSLLKLPYNIDVTNGNRVDVALIEYIGRSHPVSYYGTQLGETASWSVMIERSDVETLYALRRLSKWMGDVYVREPSGTGYWAHVVVSISQKHGDVAIPVTLDITRVEGGI